MIAKNVRAVVKFNKKSQPNVLSGNIKPLHRFPTQMSSICVNINQPSTKRSSRVANSIWQQQSAPRLVAALNPFCLHTAASENAEACNSASLNVEGTTSQICGCVQTFKTTKRIKILWFLYELLTQSRLRHIHILHQGFSQFQRSPKTTIFMVVKGPSIRVRCPVQYRFVPTYPKNNIFAHKKNMKKTWFLSPYHHGNRILIRDKPG